MKYKKLMQDINVIITELDLLRSKKKDLMKEVTSVDDVIIELKEKLRKLDEERLKLEYIKVYE